MQVVLQGCRTSLRLVEALKLQEQLKIPTKSLSEGVKRKVGGGLHVTLCTPQISARCAVALFPAVLGAEHPGRPVSGDSGRAVHGGGPRGTVANVVRGIVLSVELVV